MRSYKNLSDHDFELLVADLLGSAAGKSFEVFARGADGGVDVRHLGADGQLDVVQCKHMEGSTFSQLRAAAKKEAKKIGELNPKPARYRLVTTRTLTAGNKSELRKILSPWVERDSDIVGAEDLELLLNAAPEVERRHVKLWLTSAAQLSQSIHAAIWTRSGQMLAAIQKAIPKYVDTGVFGVASRRLYDEKVLILSGPPGIGKTSVAQMLVAEAVALGYEPIEISADIEEGNRVVDPNKKQILLYDDFLGATFLETRLSKNEDKRIVSFMARCRASPNTLLILTTREYILKQASSWSEVLDREGLPMQRMLIELTSYSRRERALILYNHLYMASKLPAEAKRALLPDRAYLKIVDHKNYNPRIIEFVTSGYSNLLDPDRYLDFVLSNLDEPEQVWRTAFEQQLDDDSRDVVLLLSTMPSAITVDELERSFAALAAARGKLIAHGAVTKALRVLDDSLTRSWSGLRGPEVAIANPSVGDFAGAWLRANPLDAEALINSVVYFEQLDWIRGQVVAPKAGAGVARYREAFNASILRTTDAAPLGFSMNWVQNRWYMAYRESRGIEGRLVFALRSANDFPKSAPDSTFQAWLRAKVEIVAARWREGRVEDMENALALLEWMSDGGSLPDVLKEAAIDAMKRASSAGDWEAVANFLEDNPEATGVQMDQLAGDFEAWIDDALTSDLDSFSDTDALNALEQTAERFSISTSGWLWQDAFDQVTARTNGWDGEPSPKRDSVPSPEREVSDAELEGIFGRFGAWEEDGATAAGQ
ncbi:hypothetical protein ASE16_12150 [Leifsonia sp. Root227]|uniref:nSTAND3 domain-containing NTPase n=1 Tax=Leifsonia sp. Root227 TaxID=1736496 RepID=UPI000713C678|nr:restriction endonuclease [Leifsonia sp. Root227]KRC49483.1 hypothetical protein ASE16_12150 [Leifsonia sp. Root227]